MVTRLIGGLTPGDGADPRTFPAIWNATADTIESQGSAIVAVEGSAVALGSAISAIEAWDLDDLNDVTIGTAVANGDLLAYSTAVSGWVNTTPTPVGLVHIRTETFSSVTAVNFPDNVFTSTYDNYRIVFNFTGAGNTSVSVRVKAAGSVNSSSNYRYVRSGYVAGAFVDGPAITTSFNNLLSTNPGGSNAWTGAGSADIFSPALSRRTSLSATTNANQGTELFSILYAGQMDVTTAYDSFNFLSTANVSGEISLFGYRK